MVVLIEIPKVHCRLCFDQLWSAHIQKFQGLFVDNETTEHDVFDNEFVPSSQWLFADRYPSNTEMKMSSLCFCQQSSPNREFFVLHFMTTWISFLPHPKKDKMSILVVA